MTTPTNREAVNEKYITLEGVKSRNNFGQLEYLVTDLLSLKDIRKTHLDLLREVEREVIGKAPYCGGDHKLHGYEYESCDACQYIVAFTVSQKEKLSHIITRVEGEA